MDIVINNSKFEKIINNRQRLQKAYGQTNATIIRRRLDDLKAATVLEDVRFLPGKWHELTGDRKGQIAVSVEQPYRLIIEPCHSPLPLKPDGGLNWSAVTCVSVIEIVNYHE